MAFYIRKSIRVGPLRFNLSKSGIGVSGGVRGMRVGAGPRGNYIHMGRGGLYYRRSLSSRPDQDQPESKPRPVDSGRMPAPTHGPLEAITSASVSQMVDASSVDLLREIEHKRRLIRLWPIASVIALVALVLMFANGVTLWLTIPALLVMTFIVCYLGRRDVLKKSVVMMYDLDEECAGAYRSLYESVCSLAKCGATWHVHARGDVYDSKYHAGAGKLIRRNRIHVSEKDPPFIRINVPTIEIPLGSKSLYFFPDRILIFGSDGVGALGYDDLRIDVEHSRFIEDGAVPRDADVVDHTWRYVNKRGGPDRRFKDNRQLPVCLYEEIRLHSDAGLNEVLQISREGHGADLRRSIAEVASAIETAKLGRDQAKCESSSFGRVPGVGDNQEECLDATAETQPKMEYGVFELLFDVLGCVMVADGRASRSEKAMIIELMQKANAPWTRRAIEHRIDVFIQRVKEERYSTILSRTMAQIELFKRIGQEEILLKSIQSLANADGLLSPKEEALCARIRDAVS